MVDRPGGGCRFAVEGNVRGWQPLKEGKWLSLTGTQAAGWRQTGSHGGRLQGGDTTHSTSCGGGGGQKKERCSRLQPVAAWPDAGRLAWIVVPGKRCLPQTQAAVHGRKPEAGADGGERNGCAQQETWI
jgi:hypothetical protein